MFAYFRTDPLFRKFRHNQITFSLLYAFNENFLLPVSHDEVVHGKASLIAKMPGDEWQRFANVRAFLGSHVRPSGQEAPFHGLRSSASTRNGTGRRQRALGPAAVRLSTARFRTYVRELNALLPPPSRRLYEVDYPLERASSGSISRTLITRAIISFIRRAENRPRFHGVLGLQFHPVSRGIITASACPSPASTARSSTATGSISAAAAWSTMENCGRTAWRCTARRQSLSLTLPPLAVAVYRRVGG